MQLLARPSGPLSGAARPPGDKSISHRAFILGALARGTTRARGILEGDDVLRTAAAMRALGAAIARTDDASWRIEGVGAAGLKSPEAIIDCGNSGTGVRLIMGAAAGYSIQAEFTGDSSLRGRPMGRVLAPLRQMGARFAGAAGDKLPIRLEGGGLHGIAYRMPVASAQVKSAILLAGLKADGAVEVIEPASSRDHTERMLRAFGADVFITDGGEGRIIRLGAQRALEAGAEILVPADPSSAAFAIVAALIIPGSSVRMENVLLNSLRAGLFDTLLEMGGDLTIENEHDASGEIVGDIVARGSKLKGVLVPPERAPAMIDEYPILAVAAAFAEGETIMRGIGEMRVKESDRIALTVAGLRACGVDAEEEPEGMIVRGTGAKPKGGADVRTAGDHRIAMSHLVLGLGAQAGVRVDEPEMIQTSFPDFPGFMRALGGDIS